MDRDICQVVAENVIAAIGHSAYRSDRALAKAAGVSPNTLRYLKHPEARAPGKKGRVSPQLDSLDKIARAMGFEGWQLMLRDFDPENPPSLVLTKREAQWHRSIEQAYRALPDPSKN